MEQEDVMTATDKLRRLLDERGVEWDELVGHPVVVGTEWHDRYGCPCTALEHADDVPDGMLSVQANLTPEQAIEATLGGGECELPTTCIDHGHIEYNGVAEWRKCSGCGREILAYPANFCPNCGRKVVE